MDKKSKSVLIVLSIATFIVAFLLATFYDYEISESISRLTDGKYLSDNLFGRFFESFGESPLYLIGGFSASILVRVSLKNRNLILKVFLTALCLCLGVLAYYLLFQRTTEYICEHLGKIRLYEEIKLFVSLGAIVLSLGGLALTLYLTFKISENQLKGLFAFSFVTTIMRFLDISVF